MRNIIVYRIANPIYHNPRTIITQITYCTDCMLLPQIPKILRCNVVDICTVESRYGPLTRYVKLRVAHAPGMFSPPPRASMLHGTCVTHVPWSMPGSLTSGFLWWRGNRSSIPSACAPLNFAYLVKRPVMVLGQSPPRQSPPRTLPTRTLPTKAVPLRIL